MTRILISEGERPRVSGFSFKATFQLVLIFGAETWVWYGSGGGFPGPGGADNDGADPVAEDIQEVGVHLGRGGKSGGGV